MADDRDERERESPGAALEPRVDGGWRLSNGFSSADSDLRGVGPPATPAFGPAATIFQKHPPSSVSPEAPAAVCPAQSPQSQWEPEQRRREMGDGPALTSRSSELHSLW
eukprot:scaffold5298_cov131-Isochrysis_galbana.AAC.5